MDPKKLMPMNKSETTVLWQLLEKKEKTEWKGSHFGCLSNRLFQNLADESFSQKIVSET